MIQCECRYDDKYVMREAFTLSEFDFTKLEAKREKVKDLYINLPMTLDIETSTIFDKEKSSKTHKEEYQAFLNHWQVCLEGSVIFGRTWQGMQELMDKLKEVYKLEKKRKLVIYIHNLSYEFHFMYRFFNFTDVFCTDVHKILRATIDDCIELRCSYMLSNMNLAKFVSNTPNAHYLKAVGYFDYNKVYTPADPFTLREYGYCYNDVMGLYEAILYKLKTDTLKTIPMTSTGYIRRITRNMMRKSKSNWKRFQHLRLDMEMYKLLREVFRGGNTASNRFLTDVILEDVDSYDISSSYPFAMISEKYPSGEFMSYEIESYEELKTFNEKYCTVARYTFVNLRIKDHVPIPYIPYSKCNKAKGFDGLPMLYNGRVMEAELVNISLTNIDFDIIEKQYDFDELYVNDFHFCWKDYLPYELRQVIYKLFYNKSTLKGVQGKEYEYMQDKARLNSTYGMMVTNILHDTVKFLQDGTFEVTEGGEEELDHYFNSRNNFLAYQWGVFVTAYARRNLQRAIDRVGDDVVYCDTDSVKYINKHDDVFKEINESINKYCIENNIINFVELKNGKRMYLGIFDFDGHYDKFKTLGAKKYCFETDGKIGVTVAGLAKKEGAAELQKTGGIEAFEIGHVFNDSGRTVAYYNNDEVHTINVHGVDILTGSSIAIVPTTYTLGITDQMASVLDMIANLR